MVETCISIILSIILYILLFGEPGYIIPTIEKELEPEVDYIVNDEEEIEFDDNLFNEDNSEDDESEVVLN